MGGGVILSLNPALPLSKKGDGLAFFQLTQTLPKGAKIFIIFSKVNNFSRFSLIFWHPHPNKPSPRGIFVVGVNKVFSE